MIFFENNIRIYNVHEIVFKIVTYQLMYRSFIYSQRIIHELRLTRCFLSDDLKDHKYEFTESIILCSSWLIVYLYYVALKFDT